MNIFLKILLYLIIFSILHFGYDLTGWSFLIPFCGINESIYQHLKIGFWAYLITILTEFFIVKRKINRISNFWYPRFFSAAIVPWMIFLIWFLVPAIFGKLSSPVAEVLWAVFSTYIAGVSTVLVERNFEQIDISNPVKITILILLIISAFLYIKFTYQLPWVDMFANPEAIQNKMFQDFFVPFLTIGVAELGDKTQIAILCLATQTRKHLLLLLGVVLAFFITDGIAVLLGNFATNIVPENYIKIAGGMIFIIFGVITLLKKEDNKTECELKNPFLTSFGVIFVSEFGDKTQIAAGLFATKYNPVLVLIGVILALTILSLMAIFIGRFLTERINRKIISYIAGVIFIIIGIIYIISGL